MIDGRDGVDQMETDDSAAWAAVRELRRAQNLERSDGSWKPPRADGMTFEEGSELFATAARLRHRAIPVLLDYALHPILGKASLLFVIELLAGADAMQRIWLDRRIRRSSGWVRRPRQGDSAWLRLTSRQVTLTPEQVAGSVGDLGMTEWGLFAMAPDGHLRERALEHLTAEVDALSLAHVLIRTLDWVRQVRSKAIAAWVASMSRLAPEQLIPLTPLVAHLSTGTWQERAAYETPHFARLDPSVVKAFEDRFAGEEGESVLLRTVRKARPREARASFALLVARQTEPSTVLDVGLRSGDVTIQRRAFAEALPAAPAERSQGLALALRSAFAEMRIKALEQFAGEDAGNGINGHLTEALFDASESVRAFARFQLKRHGLDPAASYRVAVQNANDPRRLIACILALAEVERNWMAAADHLDDPRPAVRAAAALAIGSADADAAQELLPPRLADPSPAVSSAARRGLERVGVIRFEDLAEYLADSRPHVWRNASRLLNKSGTWPWLLAALQLVQSSDPQRRSAGMLQVSSWAMRSYVPHRGPQAELRAGLVDAAAGVSAFPRIVIDSFVEYGLSLPRFRDLAFGSNQAVDVAAHDVAYACQLRLVKRYSSKRGGWYFTNRPDVEVDGAGLAEGVVVQLNRDYGDLAEPTFPEWKALVYVLTTTSPATREAELTAAGLRLIHSAESLVGHPGL